MQIFQPINEKYCAVFLLQCNSCVSEYSTNVCADFQTDWEEILSQRWNIRCKFVQNFAHGGSQWRFLRRLKSHILNGRDDYQSAHMGHAFSKLYNTFCTPQTVHNAEYTMHNYIFKMYIEHQTAMSDCEFVSLQIGSSTTLSSTPLCSYISSLIMHICIDRKNEK